MLEKDKVQQTNKTQNKRKCYMRGAWFHHGWAVKSSPLLEPKLISGAVVMLPLALM